MEVQEPSLALSRSGDFDDGALAPIRIAECAKLMNPVDDPIYNGALPAPVGAGSRDPLDGMPSPAVGFPRHASISADGFQGHITLAWLLVRCRIVLGPYLMRSRRQYGREGLGSVRMKKRGRRGEGERGRQSLTASLRQV